MELSVIIATYNRCNDLEDCIKSLMKTARKPREIIVVDSSSTDNTSKLAQKYPIKYIPILEKNRQVARNVGLFASKGDIVAFLDDDVIVDENWPACLLIPYEQSNVGGVGGRVIPYGKSTNYFVKTRKLEVGKVHANGLVMGNFDTPLANFIQVDHIPGCNMSFRRELLMQVGGFDENFQGTCFRDDTDVCLRIKKIGYKLIYQPKALVWHKFMGRVIDEKWAYWYIRNSMYFYFKDIFPTMRHCFPQFLLRLFLLPRDYVKKSQIHVSFNPSLFFGITKGVLDGFLSIQDERCLCKFNEL